MIDKLRLRRLFSRAAKDYDRYALLQAKISEDLFNKLRKIDKSLSILDVGVGTGRLTEKLSLSFPEAKIFGLDFAFGMLRQAMNRKIYPSLIQSDAQFLPFKDNSFDLVISNLSYQWVDNLVDAFDQIHNVLKKEGGFFITIFGRDTLKELRLSFLEARRLRYGEIKPLYLQLPDEEGLHETLTRLGFRNIEISRKLKKKTYRNLFSLLKWLKATGSNYSSGDLFNNLGSRQILEETAEVYRARYRDNGNIYASFEVIYAEARK